ncbi:MAG: DMT family transporter [SAR324 cluster bacterium]|nr:DMT family transporter [SAR324 cluster bacterium]MBL7035702.1 DMT family transporter [SAR324 cluster bacterium]
MGNESKGMILGTLGVVSFGLTLPATRFIIPYFDPIFIGLGRAVMASIVAAVLLIATKQKRPNQQQLIQLLGVAAGVVVGFPVLSAWAMQTVPASHGGVVLGLLPLATAMAAALFANEKPSAGFWIFAVIGSTIVITFSLLQGLGSLQSGDFLLLGAIVSAASGYALGGKLSKVIGGWQVICWALVISFPFIIVPAWLQVPQAAIESLPLNVLLSFLYLALVSQLFGFFLWNKGLALGGIARVSQTQLLQPIVTLVASALLLNEIVDLQTVIFTLLVVGSVAIGKQMPVLERS